MLDPMAAADVVVSLGEKLENDYLHKHTHTLSVRDIESIWVLLKPSQLPRGFNSIILGAIYQ